MTDEEAMEALLNSDGYSFPTWTLKLGLPTDEMRLVMSLIASDKAPIPIDERGWRRIGDGSLDGHRPRMPSGAKRVQAVS